MYPEIMVVPMREELTRLGIKEARTAAEVDRVFARLDALGVAEAESDAPVVALRLLQ